MGLFATKTATATTHDYTVRGWGHDFTIDRLSDGGKKVEASGWGDGIREDDFLMLPNGDRPTRYKVRRIKYMSDPTDMWMATLTFAPR